MKFSNLSSRPREVVRALVDFALRELEIVWDIRVVVRDARAGATDHGRGSQWMAKLHVGADSAFPARGLSYPGLSTAPTYDLADWTEALVKLAAHEFQHARQFRFRRPCSEIEADRVALAVLTAWRERGAPILAAAEERARAAGERSLARAGEREARAAAQRAEAPAAKVALLERRIKEWTTRRKRAETALRKYGRQLARARKAIGGPS